MQLIIAIFILCAAFLDAGSRKVSSRRLALLQRLDLDLNSRLHVGAAFSVQ